MILVRYLVAALIVAPTVALAEAATSEAPVRTILDGALTINGIVTILAVIGSALGIITFFQRSRQHTEKDAQDREDRIVNAMGKRNEELKDELRDIRVTLGERLKAVETSIADFMPRAEIEGKIEHEKNNRLGGDTAAAGLIQRHDERLGRLEVDVGRLTERQGGVTTEVAEIKAMLRDGLREQSAAIDKLADKIEQERRRP